MVCNSQRRLTVVLFIGGNSQLSQPLRGGVGGLVDQVGGGDSRCGLAGRDRKRRSLPPGDHGGDEQRGEHSAKNLFGQGKSLHGAVLLMSAADGFVRGLVERPRDEAALRNLDLVESTVRHRKERRAPI